MHFTHIALLLALLCSPACALTRSYDRGPVPLSDKVNLHWTLHNATQRISLAVTFSDANVLSGNRSIWIGLGISERTSGSMLGADIATAFFNPGVLANCTLTDRYVPFAAYPLRESTDNASRVFPNRDRCQDDDSWTLVSCKRNVNGTATLEVDRGLKAHDAQDREIGPGNQAVIFAYGNTGFGYHDNNRGSARIVLFNENGTYPQTQQLQLPSDVTFKHDVLATNYTVPSANVTTYSCTSTIVPVPKGGKRVLVAADPVLQTVSGDNKVHHLLVYACRDTPFGRKFLKTNTCMDGGPASPDGNCTALIYGWAVGGGRFLFPDNVGFTIDETNNFIIMETHFDNPDGATNAIDRSGARLHFADERPVQAGVIQLGDPTVSLGGRTVKHDFKYESSCPSNCTATWKEEINVIVSFLHMHTTGRNIYTNRYDKNGTFIETINGIEFWSNDHQIGLPFSEPRKIRPGDQLSTTCIFDTRKRPNTTFGLETKDEMCIDFLFYYPLQKRFASDGALFTCSMFALRNDTATICGDLNNPRAFSQQKNPTFRDTRGLPRSFGSSPPTCPVSGSANDSSDPVCFPGASVVHTRRGTVQMAQLRVGDEVLVGDAAYSRVFMFTHRVPRGIFAFVEVRTASRALTLSAGHFLYANGQLVAARDVRVGDRVQLADQRSEDVVAVRRVMREGLYNPQTVHGDIVVDGVRTSTYTQVMPPKVAHAALAPLRAVVQVLGVRMSGFEDDRYAVVRWFREGRRWMMG